MTVPIPPFRHPQIKKVGNLRILIMDEIKQNAKQALSIANHAYVLEVGNMVISGTGAELAASDEIRKAYLGG